MKKLMILAVAACAAMLMAKSEDTFLYWMVDVSDNADYSFSYATIKGVGSDGATSDYLSLYGGGSTEAIGNKLASESYPALGTTTGGGMFAGVSGYGVGSSFLVELWAESATENVDPTRVAWGTLAYSTVLNSVYSGMSQSGASPYTVTASQVVPEPTIKGIRVADGYVYVTVANTAPYLQYNLAAGTDPANLGEAKAAETPVNGKAGEDIILVAPAKSEGGFFRVGRH